MGFKPVFILPGGERGRNAQVFATEEEARESALARFRVWTAPTGIDVEPTDEPVNYRRIDGRDEMVEK
jgi:hypothetical protein